MISRKYKLPIRQVVLYLGEEESKMITQLPDGAVFSGFELIAVNKIDMEEFLADQFPEVIIMALLSNYEKEHIEEVLYTIVDKIKKVVKHEDTLKRYINQLLILSRLRKLEKSVTKILEDMPITFEVDVENDYLYKRGLEKGKEELKEEIVKKEEEFKEEIVKKEEEFKEEIVKKEEKFKEEIVKEIELREQAKREKEKIEKKAVIGFFKAGVDVKTIATTLGISQKRVKEIIKGI